MINVFLSRNDSENFCSSSIGKVTSRATPKVLSKKFPKECFSGNVLLTPVPCVSHARVFFLEITGFVHCRIKKKIGAFFVPRGQRWPLQESDDNTSGAQLKFLGKKYELNKRDRVIWVLA